MLNRPILVTGASLRDEFSCPITRELMRDPVIAADGHTYDREAIEMWLRNHDTSPKTGQPMEQLSLVPNLNLRRLIKDLLNEGGEGLYVQHVNVDGTDGEREKKLGGGGRGREGDSRSGQDTQEEREYRYALVAEQILVLKCLGPTDSDWNDKSFRVTERGCVGGRKQPALLEGADFMQFSDATVSRRHFGIAFDREEKRFSLIDFGSAGGTFVRLATGVPTPLYPSMMIMLGKHQLEVTRAPSPPAEMMEIDHVPLVAADDKSNAPVLRPSRPRVSHLLTSAVGPANRGAGGAGVREGAVTDQEEGGGSRERGRPSSRSSPKGFKLDEAMSSLRITGSLGGDGSSWALGLERDGGTGAPMLDLAGSEHEHRPRQDSSRSPLPHDDAAGGEDDASVLDTLLQRNDGNGEDGAATDDEKESGSHDKSFEAGVKLARGHRRVCLECFAPEGTPIQGSRFFVGREGATLGRKQSNTIAFSHESNGTVMGIDASISGDHARIEYDEEGDCLHILDGTSTKPSTNGTWFRLSGMHKESRPYPLSNGAEILIGTVRFSVKLETMVVEKELTVDNRDYYMSLVAKSGSRLTGPWGAVRDSRQGGRGGGGGRRNGEGVI